jgi:hypothetical protein
VFRAAVPCDGVPVSDVVQVWLDAGAYPSRGPEQADMIYRKVLRPLLDKGIAFITPVEALRQGWGGRPSADGRLCPVAGVPRGVPI